MALFGKLLIAVGTALLLHAGYYSVQCALVHAYYRLWRSLGQI